jgi:hypothetical protein
MEYHLVHPDGTRQPLPEGVQIMALQPFESSNSPSTRQMNQYLFIIWVVVLGILGLTLFVFGILAFKARSDPSTAAFLMAPATTALGAIAGLLAPSPATSAAADK